MVGLPARGKSYIARKLAYYLNWVNIKTNGPLRCTARLHHAAAVFNLGAYRRQLVPDSKTAAFFDPANESAAVQRECGRSSS